MCILAQFYFTILSFKCNFIIGGNGRSKPDEDRTGIGIGNKILTVVQMICAVEIKRRKRTVLVEFMVKYGFSGDFQKVQFIYYLLRVLDMPSRRRRKIA